MRTNKAIVTSAVNGKLTVWMPRDIALALRNTIPIHQSLLAYGRVAHLRVDNAVHMAVLVSLGIEVTEKLINEANRLL